MAVTLNPMSVSSARPIDGLFQPKLKSALSPKLQMRTEIRTRGSQDAYEVQAES